MSNPHLLFTPLSLNLSLNPQVSSWPIWHSKAVAWCYFLVWLVCTENLRCRTAGLLKEDKQCLSYLRVTESFLTVWSHPCTGKSLLWGMYFDTLWSGHSVHSIDWVQYICYLFVGLDNSVRWVLLNFVILIIQPCFSLVVLLVILAAVIPQACTMLREESIQDTN